MDLGVRLPSDLRPLPRACHCSPRALSLSIHIYIYIVSISLSLSLSLYIYIYIYIYWVLRRLDTLSYRFLGAPC